MLSDPVIVGIVLLFTFFFLILVLWEWWTLARDQGYSKGLARIKIALRFAGRGVYAQALFVLIWAIYPVFFVFGWLDLLTKSWLQLSFPGATIVQLMGIVLLAMAGILIVQALRGIKSGALTTTGPYAFIRHPMYTGYLFAFAGLFALTLNIPALIPVVVGLGVSREAAYQEEKALRIDFRRDYTKYAEETGQFLPRVHPGGPILDYFSELLLEIFKKVPYLVIAGLLAGFFAAILVSIFITPPEVFTSDAFLDPIGVGSGVDSSSIKWTYSTHPRIDIFLINFIYTITDQKSKIADHWVYCDFDVQPSSDSIDWSDYSRIEFDIFGDDTNHALLFNIFARPPGGSDPHWHQFTANKYITYTKEGTHVSVNLSEKEMLLAEHEKDKTNKFSRGRVFAFGFSETSNIATTNTIYIYNINLIKSGGEKKPLSPSGTGTYITIKFGNVTLAKNTGGGIGFAEPLFDFNWLIDKNTDLPSAE